MQRDEDEDAWRSIVDNFGDRAELDEDPELPVDPAPPVFRLEEAVARAEPAAVEDHDRFIPPDPPLPPRPTRDRQLAWAGVLGTPVLVLVLLLLGVHLPSLLAYALVGAFVGGFLYLVVGLPRSSDDPFDDGARL